MVRAGLDELRDLARSREDDKAHLVSSIYMAMEYARREAGAKPTSLPRQSMPLGG
jgi:hypothetical protein